MQVGTVAAGIGVGVAAGVANTNIARHFAERDQSGWALNVTATGSIWGGGTALVSHILLETGNVSHQGFRYARAAGLGLAVGTFAGFANGLRQGT